jgi:hypothetical protein
VKLVGDGEAANEGVDDLVSRRLNAGGKIELSALRDGMLHGENIVGGVWSLYAEEKIYINGEMRTRHAGLT